ncbi:MAG: copper-binding protein [Sphingopyxis granuli]|jgi:Cu/Ag efflux protein CusF|uniref:Cu/Ag efflux protein CusF n=2 Tax=Sphingomonadales TaxID=204457 RepID=A0A397PEM6_9SPHN|nr:MULTISPECIES: copper-binding protein [Sphingomonadaceae]MBN9506651.1 copper-binding protein [Altererythrobacter sp.]OJU60505.1 MAG: copper-binding protein [Altererythrobacter sp. 66-12]PTD24148.1 copper-binding protein [Sphingomonas fennica]RIA44111.1 Cu/Ag efflux protein CusF [Hephaestia caeni]
MKSLSILALGSAVLLAACGQNADKPDNTAEASATMGDMSGDMGNMAMPAETAKVAKGTGTVKAIDETAGTITLEHGPIAEANWPAMTMAFKAAPALIDSVAVGDKVAFDLALKDGIGEVTAIQKQ